MKRAAAFFVLWLACAGADPVAAVVGAFTAGAAARLSLSLLPPGGTGLRWGEVFALLLRFPLQSFAAGVDAARRALDPRLPPRPGMVACPLRLPGGMSRSLFRTCMSLQPGLLPVAMRDDATLLVHALDAGRPVAREVAAEETRWLRLLADEPLAGGRADG